MDYLSIEAAGELRTKKVVYIGMEIVDAALSLIDRKLTENAHYVEGVQVYYNTD